MPADEISTQERILSAGKEEFLTKGFAEASLRNIAAKAGVTTGAIYGYYSDKNALFTALVEPAAAEFTRQFLYVHDRYEYTPIDLTFETSTNALNGMMDYIYENFDSFRLLICCSAGSAYEDYIEFLVEKEDESTLKYAEILRQNGYSVEPFSPTLVHILSRGFFSALFETVAHSMKKEEAKQYVNHIANFYRAGWIHLFGAE